MRYVLDKNKNRLGRIIESDDLFIKVEFNSHPRKVTIAKKVIDSKSSNFLIISKDIPEIDSD